MFRKKTAECKIKSIPQHSTFHSKYVILGNCAL